MTFDDLRAGDIAVLEEEDKQSIIGRVMGSNWNSAVGTTCSGRVFFVPIHDSARIVHVKGYSRTVGLTGPNESYLCGSYVDNNINAYAKNLTVIQRPESAM